MRPSHVHYVPEASMRIVACLAMCLILILSNAAQIGAQAPSHPQGCCVNGSADFYPYTIKMLEDAGILTWCNRRARVTVSARSSPLCEIFVTECEWDHTWKGKK
jgi:hypothetical protein